MKKKSAKKSKTKKTKQRSRKKTAPKKTLKIPEKPKSKKPAQKKQEKQFNLASGKESLDYEAKCSCGFSARLKYGRRADGEIFELFSCPKCRNLFSIKLEENRACPICKNQDLISYNPHKKQNLEFYNEMAAEKQLSQERLDELKGYWTNVKDNDCPRCRKKSLEWKEI